MHAAYLDALRSFEGYTREARWDYQQHSNGYGTRARYPGERISETEARRRFQDAVREAANLVERFAPGLDEGTKAALTSLTYNAGTRWMKSGLGASVKSGDLNAARERFLSYNKAGGVVIEGLSVRRAIEAGWIGGSGPANVGSGTAEAGRRSSARDAWEIGGAIPEAPLDARPVHAQSKAQPVDASKSNVLPGGSAVPERPGAIVEDMQAGEGMAEAFRTLSESAGLLRVLLAARSNDRRNTA